MIYLLSALSFSLLLLVGCASGPDAASNSEAAYEMTPPARPLARLGIVDSLSLLDGDEKTKAAQYRTIVRAARREGLAELPEAQAEWNRTLYDIFLYRKLKEAGLPTEATEHQLKEMYQAAPLLRVRDLILLASSPAEKEGAKKKIEEIRAEYKKGTPFPKLVQKYSDDPSTRARGGDLDFRGDHNFPPALYSAAKETEVNSLSAPVDLGDSIHIIQVSAKRPFNEAGAPYLEFLRNRRRAKEIHQFTERLITELNKNAEGTTRRENPREYFRGMGNPRVESPSLKKDRVAENGEGVVVP